VSDQLDLIVADRAGAFHAPWRGAPNTERQAARAVAPISGKQRCRYALAIVDAGVRGLTDHEACAAGIGSSYHVAGTRRKELVTEDGLELVVDSALRRQSPHGRPCAVWIARRELVDLVREHRIAITERAR
jgi:hypothetical protein